MAFWQGMAGAVVGVMLKDGDFHPDMIDQFETWSGIKVKGEKTSEQADFIWNDPGNSVSLDEVLCAEVGFFL